MQTVDNRIREWLLFASEVAQHVAYYTVPQYGDLPDDPLSKWTAEDCVRQIGKYVNRFESNARGDLEGLIDMKKAAHYACVAYMKLQKRLEELKDDNAG